MNLSAFQLANSVNDLASPGLLGFTVIALVGGALFLLMRSMRRHLNAVRSSDLGAEAAEATASEQDSRREAGDQAD